MAQNFNYVIFSRAIHTSYWQKIVIIYILFYLEFYFLPNVRHNKLFQEAFIFTPEQSDVRDIVQDHGQPLQTQAKCPANFILSTSCNKQINKIKIQELKFTTWKIADKMFIYLPREKKKKKKWSGKTEKPISNGQMKDLKTTGQILLPSKTAARLGTSQSPGTKSDNKIKPHPWQFVSKVSDRLWEMLHKAIQHFPLLSLELSTSTPDSVVFYKTCKHEFPVQNILLGLTDQAKPMQH